MTLTRHLTLFAMALVGLVGCGNGDQRADLEDLRSLAKGAFEGRQAVPSPAANDAAIAQASQQALKLMPPNEPLASVTFDAVGIAAVLRRIETNGHHVTWAAWDSTDRKSITTKHGMIVATRSLVQDLMSAEADGVLALVRGRHAGTTPYALRYIDGNYDTIEEAYTCRVSRGTEQAVKLANGVVVPAVEMVSECSSQSRQFVDRFMVDRSGRIVQMRQWVGPVLGFADMALLR